MASGNDDMFPQMSIMENLEIIELTNGVKVISLMGEIKFNDGTIVPGQELKLRNRSVPQNYDFDKKLVSERIGAAIVESGKFRLMKRLTVPLVENYQEILKNIPEDCIVLVREYIAEAWGFPFVCPINDGRGGNFYRLDAFYSA